MNLTLERVINQSDIPSRQIYSVFARRRGCTEKIRLEKPDPPEKPEGGKLSKSLDIRLHRLVQPDWKYKYNGYTVEIGDHRVLTLSTGCPITASKWFKQVLKTNNTKNGALIVGLSVDEPKDGWEKIVQICTGSHCLILRLPLKEDYGYMFTRMTSVLKMMREFFGSHKVFAVAAAPDGDDGMKSIKALKEEYEIAISDPVEVVSAATLAQKANQIGIRDWPQKPEWYPDRWPRIDWPIQFRDDDIFTDDKVKHCTLRTYLCFLIGNETLDQVKAHHHFPSTSAKKKNKK